MDGNVVRRLKGDTPRGKNEEPSMPDIAIETHEKTCFLSELQSKVGGKAGVLEPPTQLKKVDKTE